MDAALAASAPDTRHREALDRALARADAYRLLSGAFRDPDGPHAADLEVEALLSAAEALGIRAAAEQRIAVLPMADRATRGHEHRRIFGHVVAQGCPPYETEFGQGHVFGQAQELGDISGFYQAFGLRAARSGERPDHLACELEFLAVVAIKEAYALAREDETLAAVCRVAAAAFLRDHPGRWTPAFAALVEQRAPGTGYAGLAALAARVVAQHAAELAVTPERLGPGDPRAITAEPDSFSFSCGVDDADADIPG